MAAWHHGHKHKTILHMMSLFPLKKKIGHMAMIQQEAETGFRYLLLCSNIVYTYLKPDLVNLRKNNLPPPLSTKDC